MYTRSPADDGCVPAAAMDAADVEQIKGIWGSECPALDSSLFSIRSTKTLPVRSVCVLTCVCVCVFCIPRVCMHGRCMGENWCYGGFSQYPAINHLSADIHRSHIRVRCCMQMNS